jgi:hypothetical protein
MFVGVAGKIELAVRKAKVETAPRGDLGFS